MATYSWNTFFGKNKKTVEQMEKCPEVIQINGAIATSMSGNLTYCYIFTTSWSADTIEEVCQYFRNCRQINVYYSKFHNDLCFSWGK